MTPATEDRRTLLVLASTYPRWRDDPEPAFVHELCRRLSASFNVVALVPDSPGADPSGVLDGVEVIRYRYAPRAMQSLVNNGGIAANLKAQPWKWLLLPGFVVAQYLAARRILKSRRVDVVHAHWLIAQGLVARAATWRTQIPYVVTSHGGDLFALRGRLLTAIKRWVAAGAASMTVVSSAMKSECAQLGLAAPNIEVLPMGVDLHGRFVSDSSVQREADTILFVGRLVAKKGVTHLLSAMPLVLKQRPGVQLSIVGFGPEEVRLREQASALQLDQCVRFVGALPQQALPALYCRAGLVVAPFVRDATGSQEGLPVALMEAIGCGCPVVVGKVDGLEDLLGEAASSICVAADDHAALAHSIISALANPLEAQAQARRVLQSASARIDWSVIAAGYSAVLSSTLLSQRMSPSEIGPNSED